MRRAWMVIGLGLLIGCGATPNASATQTRTAEVVELTVSARLLPTANAAIPPTPVPVAVAPRVETATAPSAIPSVRPSPTPDANQTKVSTALAAYPSEVPDPDTRQLTQAIMERSWVAFSPAIRVRFFAPPSLVQAPDFNNDHRYSLGSPSNVYDFEALDIYRFVGNRGGDFAQTWVAEAGTLLKGPNIYGLTTSGPRTQQVGAYQGNIGQFNYIQADNQLRISGTMWVGQVGGDEVLIVYRCTPEREGILDSEFAQVIATIDFNAR